MPASAILFDIDGTLVDSNEFHVDAWGLAFREAGHPQERDRLRGQIGKGGDLLVPALLPHADDALRERLSERHGTLFRSLYLDRVRPFADATALLRRVHAHGSKVVLASSAERAELDHYVELLGVGDIVDATTSIDDVETSKPAPDIFAAALAKAGVPAERALVVGDTTYDVAAAARAGIAAIAVTSGPFDERQLRDAGAMAVYADVAALLADFDRSPLAAEPGADDGAGSGEAPKVRAARASAVPLALAAGLAALGLCAFLSVGLRGKAGGKARRA